MNGTPSPPSGITERGADDARSGADYFDSSEFSLRATIEDTHYWHVHRRAVLLDALRGFAPPEAAGRLLEIGCGIGTVTTYLNEHGYTVDYGDFFPNAVGIAKERATARLGEKVASERRFLQVDATKPLPFKDYQGVFLLDVIEHLPDDMLVLENVRRMLDHAPGAFVFVTVPAFQFLWSPWDDVEKHKRRYTKKQLESLLDRAGFEVARSTYFFTPLFFAAAGVKGLRAVRSAIARGPEAGHIRDLAESKNVDSLNKLVTFVHGPERRWLGARRALPFGTSLLAIARAR
jgi:SAM-dependent methyltransferase